MTKKPAPGDYFFRHNGLEGEVVIYCYQSGNDHCIVDEMQGVKLIHWDNSRDYWVETPDSPAHA